MKKTKEETLNTCKIITWIKIDKLHRPTIIWLTLLWLAILPPTTTEENLYIHKQWLLMVQEPSLLDQASVLQRMDNLLIPTWRLTVLTRLHLCTERINHQSINHTSHLSIKLHLMHQLQVVQDLLSSKVPLILQLDRQEWALAMLVVWVQCTAKHLEANKAQVTVPLRTKWVIRLLVKVSQSYHFNFKFRLFKPCLLPISVLPKCVQSSVFSHFECVWFNCFATIQPCYFPISQVQCWFWALAEHSLKLPTSLKHVHSYFPSLQCCFPCLWCYKRRSNLQCRRQSYQWRWRSTKPELKRQQTMKQIQWLIKIIPSL